MTAAVVFDEDMCYDVDRGVKSFVLDGNGYRTAGIGLGRQHILSDSLDSTAPDWGYVYLAGDEAYALGESGFRMFADGKDLQSDTATERRYISAVAKGEKARIVVAFDEVAAISYFGKILRGAYLAHNTVFDAISETFANADRMLEAEAELEAEVKRCTNGDPLQSRLMTASLRQVMAAHKLVEDDGRLLFISRECHSNGCAATVDVTYPSAPMFLLFNPDLLWAMMEPIFDFAAMPCWKYDFAPHDVGIYPYCIGQMYGLKHSILRQNKPYADSERCVHLPFFSFPLENPLYDMKDQMAVEESGNMLILIASAVRAGLTNWQTKLTTERWATLETWAKYLVDHGLIPSSQLCTDDFAGHLDKNANLSVKAIVGIGAYAALLRDCGRQEEAKKYRETAEKYAAEWVKICYADGRKYAPLTMDGQGAYSLKYNLLFDKLLELKLFPESVYRAEFEATLSYANRYGAPLDERKTYTKSDWLMWMAALCEDDEARKPIYEALDRYLTETPSRVPYSDWYETETANLLRSATAVCKGAMVCRRPTA